MKAMIKVGYGCNEHCTFCHTLELRSIDAEAAEVSRKIRRAKELGHTMVVLSGGEPTIRSELMHWAAEVAALKMDFGLITNGRLLSYPEVVDRLQSLGLKYVYLSLHGGSARVHNRLVRADAFEQSCGALSVLAGRPIDVTVNCVVTRQNVDHLRELVDLVMPYERIRLKFSMVEPKGGGELLFRALTPDVFDAAARVRDAIEYGESKYDSEGRLVHGAFPLCHLKGLEDRYDDLKTHGFRSMVEVGESDFFPVDDRNKAHLPQCEGCVHQGGCPGLYRGYIELRAGGERLVPSLERPRSNSFNYRFQRFAEWGEVDCPLRDGALGISPWDRGRDLLVEHRGRVALFRADTRDFSDAEIERTKLQRGQVYLDVSRKAAVDDFAADLRKLDRSPRCEGCVHQTECSGLWVPRAVDVFGPSDEDVARRIRTLRGDVLDLGFGEGRYAEAFGASAAAAQLCYTGIDPDEDLVERQRKAWPWAHLVAGTAEAWFRQRETSSQPFDHILILRSWNHLQDPAFVIAACAHCLRDGGSLAIVDNVAFGLARSRSQTDRAESSAAGLEHFRNDGAAEVKALLARHPQFELVEESPVNLLGSNQWMLWYRRRGEQKMASKLS